MVTSTDLGRVRDFRRWAGPGSRSLRGIGLIQTLVFRILSGMLWLAPIGAFGAMAKVVGDTGFDAVVQLGVLMLAFYLTCIIFVFDVLGALLRVVAGVSIFKLVRYLAREYLLIVATSSSESALPRLIAKLEHAGVQQTTVGIVVPTGYSFNLDGTAIYLTMASLFIADAMGDPLAIGEQLSLLAFMIVASKGAAGVSGAGLAVLAGGLQSHRPELLDGIGLIVGIDRFMSEARAVTNFSGNAVATIVIGAWTNTMDQARMSDTLDGKNPFGEQDMVDDPRHTATTTGSLPTPRRVQSGDLCPVTRWSGPIRMLRRARRSSAPGRAEAGRSRRARHDRELRSRLGSSAPMPRPMGWG